MKQKIAPCPEQELLQKIAAGECPPEIANEIISHAAQCKTCGPLLKKYLAAFSDETTPEEAELISRLQTSDPGYQREWVRTHVLQRGTGPVQAPAPENGEVVRVHKPWWRMSAQWQWRVAIATAGLAAVIVAAIAVPAVIAANKISTAKKQVASAFADRRTIELRPSSVAYAPYHPFPIKLGDESGPDLDEISPSLLEARSTVTKALAEGKVDPRWMQLEGRIFLWEATPASLEKAEKDFERARAAGLNTADLDIDLAATYFELDSRDNHPNLQRTLNLLSKVLTEKDLSKENRAAALFNLALAYEKTQAWDLAANTWKDYLSVDSSSPWAEEARKRLKDAESRSSIEQPEFYTKPAEFLSRASDSQMREDAEEYQDIALALWLPHAIEDADARQAGMRLASSIAEQHGDPWLRDMFATMKGQDSGALKQLLAAIRSNATAKYGDAKKQASYAAAMFSNAQNRAGELRAQFEETYAERRSLESADCSSLADELWQQVADTKYRWLQARVLLERAECSNLKGDFSDSDSAFRTGRQIAEQSDFPILILRNLNASAGMKHLRGDCDASWKESVDALDVYWSKQHVSRQRLFQSYAVMLQCALDSGSLYSAERLIRYAIAMRQSHPEEFGRNPIVDGVLHLHLANVLLTRKEFASARTEREIALALLGKSTFLSISLIEPAELELENGDALAAEDTLKFAKDALKGSSDTFFPIRYHQVSGKVLFRLGKLHEASEEYRSAIATAEAAQTRNEGERSQWFHAIDESYRGLVRVLIEQGKQQDALNEWEHYKNQPVIHRITEKPTRPSAAYRETSQRDNVAPIARGTRLVYAMFRDGLQIWARKNGSLKGVWVKVDEPKLEHEMRDFSAKCATEESNLKDLQQQAARLYGFLVQPVGQEIQGADSLIVELDHRVSSLPMEALIAPDGAYLGEKRPIIYSPGMGTEKTLRVPTLINIQARVVFLDGSTEYLPGIEAERKAVSQLFPHSSILDTARINLSELRQRSRENEIWHYTGHGRRDGSGTRLDFNRSQSLRAVDFTPELFSRSQLVVLAACSSGRSGDRGPVDTNSLIHALLSAGVPNVIASRWNVDSLATSQLMVSFYTHLVKDGNTAEALMAARNEVLATHIHPYFWAGFGMTGMAA